MKKLKIIFFLVFIGNYSYSQQPKRDIQYLQLKDTILLKQLNVMFSELGKYGPDFKDEHGYISLHIQQFSRSSDTTITYFLSPQLTFFTEHDDDSLFPDYYSLVNKKLVTIYLTALDKFSFAEKTFTDKSKKMIAKLADKYLEKPGSAVKFQDKKTVLRFNSVTFGGTKVYVLKNKPAVIEKVPE